MKVGLALPFLNRINQEKTTLQLTGKILRLLFPHRGRQSLTLQIQGEKRQTWDIFITSAHSSPNNQTANKNRWSRKMKIISLSCPTYEALNRNTAKLIPNCYMGIKSIIFAIYSGMTEHIHLLQLCRLDLG